LTRLARAATLVRMAVKAIQPGQVWRNDQTGVNFLVTKVYSEALSQFAMLRPDSGTSSDTVRIRIQKTAQGAVLPGYTFAQEGEEF
jgi:hypothetical protein